MKAPKALIRKVGPLPVWAWSLVVIGAFVAYRYTRRQQGGASSASAKVLPVAGSAAQVPSGGGGSAADNVNAGLADALAANLGASDRLLQLVQATGGNGLGVTGGSGGGTTGSSEDTTMLTSETFDSGFNNAPTDPYSAAVASAQSTTPDYGLIAAQIPGSGADQGYALENAVLANPDIDYGQLDRQLGIPSTTDIAAQLQAYGDSIPSPMSTVTDPTPTVVQPAPVDTSTVFVPTPLPTSGHPVAV